MTVAPAAPANVSRRHANASSASARHVAWEALRRFADPPPTMLLLTSIRLPPCCVGFAVCRPFPAMRAGRSPPGPLDVGSIADPAAEGWENPVAGGWLGDASSESREALPRAPID